MLANLLPLSHRNSCNTHLVLCASTLFRAGAGFQAHSGTKNTQTVFGTDFWETAQDDCSSYFLSQCTALQLFYSRLDMQLLVSKVSGQTLLFMTGVCVVCNRCVHT